MSEIRQDLVSGDWIITAPERALRPHDFLPKKKPRVPSPKKTCPFEGLEATGNWPPYLSYPNDKDWKIVIIPNKYPALHHDATCPPLLHEGPYPVMKGAGYHDLLITRDHAKPFTDLSAKEALKVFSMLQIRYQGLSHDSCMYYTSCFFNWGATAGASLYHPHYQIVSLPIIPPHVYHSLKASEKYMKHHHKCPHCELIRFEHKEKVRVVEENAEAIALAPFASHRPFEVRIFPRKHLPNFEKTQPKDLSSIAWLLQSVLKRIRKYLNDPDLNFFIHTSPLKDKRKYHHYHWHIEILPNITLQAGFELSTGVEINVIDPDKAAALLRGRKSPPR